MNDFLGLVRCRHLTRSGFAFGLGLLRVILLRVYSNTLFHVHAGVLTQEGDGVCQACRLRGPTWQCSCLRRDFNPDDQGKVKFPVTLSKADKLIWNRGKGPNVLTCITLVIYRWASRTVIDIL